jgi:hypothetical protein
MGEILSDSTLTSTKHTHINTLCCASLKPASHATFCGTATSEWPGAMVEPQLVSNRKRLDNTHSREDGDKPWPWERAGVIDVECGL